MYDSNQFVFKQIKRVNDEEQLLRILRCLYFEIKYNTVFSLLSAGPQLSALSNKHRTSKCGAC